ncbi:MAG: LPS assembly lipoprotein LptE [Phycisphaerales bacterium]
MRRPMGDRWRRLAASVAIAIATLASMVGLGGCAGPGGYSNESIFPGEVSTIAVPIFENRTLATGLERDITDALIKEIHARTPYRVVSSTAMADTTLEAVITGVEKEKLSQQRGSGLVQELIYSATVDFEWIDHRSGRTLAARKNFRAGALYIPSLPALERQEFAEFDIAEELAREIVDAMRDEW